MIELLECDLKIFLHQPPVRGSVDPRGCRRVDATPLGRRRAYALVVAEARAVQSHFSSARDGMARRVWDLGLFCCLFPLPSEQRRDAAA
jgi:hypothetical protein